MQLVSDITRDGRHDKPDPGSYEWWYFDGISEDENYQIVIIFYDGCPFSTRYIRNMENPDAKNAMSGQHPAISISIYHKGKPIFYSLSQYPTQQCTFEKGLPVVTIGENSFRFSERENHGVLEYASFDLRINEQLPSGDELKGIITFTGMYPYEKLFSGGKEAQNGHLWNLAMPRGQLQCRMNLIKNGLIQKELKFDGVCYHDHNVGHEPMKNQFRDWYWGRAHFPQATLIYYVMNRTDGEQDVSAWLVSPDNRRLLYTLELVKMKSRRTSGFLMRPARRLIFRDNDVEISVLHHKVIDSGPFYCRYISCASLSHPSLGTETVKGLGEYIRPRRIHRRIFWPLVHMRLRYVDRKPHWVQRSARLIRWTW